MTNVREYFKSKYDKKNSPAYLQGVLRTLGRLPSEDEEIIPDSAWANKEVAEK